jgi:hypothetical protein
MLDYNIVTYWVTDDATQFVTLFYLRLHQSYIVLGPSDVVSRSSPGSTALILGSPWIWSPVALLTSLL